MCKCVCLCNACSCAEGPRDNRKLAHRDAPNRTPPSRVIQHVCVCVCLAHVREHSHIVYNTHACTHAHTLALALAHIISQRCRRPASTFGFGFPAFWDPPSGGIRATNVRVLDKNAHVRTAAHAWKLHTCTHSLALCLSRSPADCIVLYRRLHAVGVRASDKNAPNVSTTAKMMATPAGHFGVRVRCIGITAAYRSAVRWGLRGESIEEMFFLLYIAANIKGARFNFESKSAWLVIWCWPPRRRRLSRIPTISQHRRNSLRPAGTRPVRPRRAHCN